MRRSGAGPDANTIRHGWMLEFDGAHRASARASLTSTRGTGWGKNIRVEWRSLIAFSRSNMMAPRRRCPVSSCRGIWWSAKPDGDAVVGVDEADGDGEVREFFFVEVGGRSGIVGVRSARLGDQGDRFGPAQRGALPVRKDASSLPPCRDQHQLFDRDTAFEQIAGVLVDAIGTAVDLRRAQVDEINQVLGEPRPGHVHVNAAQRLHAGWRDSLIL